MYISRPFLGWLRARIIKRIPRNSIRHACTIPARSKSFMQQKKYVFKRCSRFYFKERNRKNHADKSKTIFNLCIRKLQRYPNQFRDTFLNVVPKFTRKEKICLRKSFHRDGDFLSEHFVQYFTFVPPLCDVKLI